MSREGRAAPSFSIDRACVLLLVVVLLGTLLRFYRLDAQSFWNDEGNAARIAERSLDLIVEGAAGDVHPPGYYLLLHYWRAAFGQSEFALRSLSAVAGVGLIVLTYLLGRHVHSEGTGLVASSLAAISPFAVYYSQEARMYALLGALSALSILLVLRRLGSSGSTRPPGTFSARFLVGYVLVNAAGLYTHYAFVFVMVAHNVLFGVWWLVEPGGGDRRWGTVAAWAAAQVAVVGLYLPWLPRAVAAAGWRSARSGYELGSALVDVLRVLTVGVTLPLDQAGAALAIAAALFALGSIPATLGDRPTQSPERPSMRRGATLLAYLVVPVVLFFAFDLYKPAWLKFLIVALPPFHVLVARGVHRLGGVTARGLHAVFRPSRPVWRVFRPAAWIFLALAVAGLAFPSLRNLYFNPVYFRDDYRQIAADIQAMQGHGDAVILNAPNQWEVFTYYYPDRDVYPAPYRPSGQQAQEFVVSVLQRHERLFVLYWGDAEADPSKRIESLLAERAYKAGDQWYGDVRLATYGVAPLPDDPDTPLDVLLGDPAARAASGSGEVILLKGYGLAHTGPFAPGDVVPVSLFWEVEAPVGESYKVTVQLLNRHGELSAQVDTVPRDGLAPTTDWEPGRLWIDRYGILLPTSLAPGRYSIAVAVYHALSGERLPVNKGGQEIGDYVSLRNVMIEDR